MCCSGPAPANKNKLHRATCLLEKPSVEQARASLRTPGLDKGYLGCFGLYIFMPVVFELLGDKLAKLHDSEKGGGEVGMAEPTIDLIARKEVALTTVRGARFDVGVPHEYVSSVAQLGGFRR